MLQVNSWKAKHVLIRPSLVDRNVRYFEINDKINSSTILQNTPRYISINYFFPLKFLVIARLLLQIR